MIQAKFLRTPLVQAPTTDLAFMPGATVADIVASFDLPPHFLTHGVVVLFDPKELTPYRVPQGAFVDRRHWSRVKPKDGAGVFVTTTLHDGGALLKIGAIVLAVAAAVFAPYATPFLSSALGVSSAAAGGIYAAGTAAVLLGAQYGLASLSKPVIGEQVTAGGGGGKGGPTLGQAGIAQNPLAAFKTIPGVLGTMRVSPPHLTRPYTEAVDDDEWVYFCVGLCGPLENSDIRVNEAALTDLGSDNYVIETREGYTTDAALTIVTKSVFQENIGLALSTFRTEDDGTTVTEPAASSVPQAHIFRSAHAVDRFRLGLLWPSGFYEEGQAAAQGMALRLRFRKVGDVAWTKAPEVAVRANLRVPIRQEIWFVFGGNEVVGELEIAAMNATHPRVNQLYAKNSEWTADPYFKASPTSPDDTAPLHCYITNDRLSFHLHTDSFPIGQYEFEIRRSYAYVYTSMFGQVQYPGGFFTGNLQSNGRTLIAGQTKRQHAVQLSHYTSFRNKYPINETGLALISGKIRNVQVNSISALFKSYVDGVTTDDPAVLLPYVLSGDLNPRPVDVAKIDDLTDWAAHIADKGLSCNALIAEGSVERVASLIASTGDAVIRRADKWGVMIDKDRSADSVTALFTPANMTKPLQINKTFLNGARVIMPTFLDATRDYAINETTQPVYDEGVDPEASPLLIDAVNYDGLTSEALVLRRALMDLRKARLRAILYSFETHYSHLPRARGDLVGISHDILIRCYGQSRVKSWTSAAGHLLTVTLESDIADAPTGAAATSIFDVRDVFALKDIFDLTKGEAIGMQIELASGALATIPLSAVSGAIATIEGTVALPSRLEAGCQAAIGVTGTEARRVLITGIVPKDDFYAEITAVDEAPTIFQGF